MVYSFEGHSFAKEDCYHIEKESPISVFRFNSQGILPVVYSGKVRGCFISFDKIFYLYQYSDDEEILLGRNKFELEHPDEANGGTNELPLFLIDETTTKIKLFNNLTLDSFLEKNKAFGFIGKEDVGREVAYIDKQNFREYPLYEDI